MTVGQTEQIYNDTKIDILCYFLPEMFYFERNQKPEEGVRELIS